MTLHRRNFGIAAAAVGAATLFQSAAFAQSADEGAVKQAVAGFYKAYLDADEAKLKSLISDKLTFGHSDGRLEDKAKIIGDIVAKKNIYKKFTFSIEQVAIHDSVAVVRHHVIIDAEADGKPNQAKVRILQVWQKEAGNWRLLARQAVRSDT